MAISLAKGQRISLSKKDVGLSKVLMGLGWDPAAPEPKKGGLFGRMFGSAPQAPDSIDLDASVILLDARKNVVDTVYFGQLVSDDGSVRHGGDNLTGAGDGDDEQIFVDLQRLPEQVVHLVFTVNSFRGQTFNEVANSFARLVDQVRNVEICRYDLREKGAHTGVIMASLSRTPDGWALTAHGKPCHGRTARDLAASAAEVV